MKEYPHLSNAPIKEALIDIQVELPREASANELLDISKQLSSKYPQRFKRTKLSVEIRAKDMDNSAQIQKSIPVGYAVKTEDGKEVVQFRLDGFTFSLLGHYDDWGDLRNTAYDHWKKYLDGVRPVFVRRVAVRFINDIAIRPPLEKYLKIFPQVSSTLTGIFESALVRIQNKLDNGASVIFTQAIKESQKGDVVPVIIDIDVFQEKQFDPGSDTFWEVIDSFHEVKNQYFFENLHNLAWEQYL